MTASHRYQVGSDRGIGAENQEQLFVGGNESKVSMV